MVEIVRGSINEVQAALVETRDGLRIYMPRGSITATGARALADVIETYIEARGGFQHGEALRSTSI